MLCLSHEVFGSIHRIPPDGIVPWDAQAPSGRCPIDAELPIKAGLLTHEPEEA